jgi:hypothetical protein
MRRPRPALRRIGAHERPEGDFVSGTVVTPQHPGTWIVHPLVRFADLAGTFIFGFQGALLALAAHLDLFGVLVLSFATALGAVSSAMS